jgi:uncharacterized protein (DUF58 family)
VVFLISDFLDRGFERQLAVAGKRHDLIAISLADPVERELPRVGLVELVDAESGEQRLLDTSNPDERRAYLRAWAEHSGSVERFCAGNGIDHIPIVAGQDYVTTLSRFFMARERRL